MIRIDRVRHNKVKWRVDVEEISYGVDWKICNPALGMWGVRTPYYLNDHNFEIIILNVPTFQILSYPGA